MLVVPVLLRTRGVHAINREDLKGSLGGGELLKSLSAPRDLCSSRLSFSLKFRPLAGHVGWKRFPHCDLARETIHLHYGSYLTRPQVTIDMDQHKQDQADEIPFDRNREYSHDDSHAYCLGYNISRAPITSYKDRTTRTSLLIRRQKSCCKECIKPNQRNVYFESSSVHARKEKEKEKSTIKKKETPSMATFACLDVSFWACHRAPIQVRVEPLPLVTGQTMFFTPYGCVCSAPFADI